MIRLLIILVFMILFFFIYRFWDLIFIFNILIIGLFLKFSLNYYVINISYEFGYDLLSYSLILLRLWISILILMAREKLVSKNFYWKEFILINLVLLISLILVFRSLNLFIFYLFFEIRLIPLLIIILGWGYQPERIQAGIYLLFYTLIASLPIIIVIFFCFDRFITLNFFFIKFNNIDNFLFYIFINLVFLVKIPIYFIHLWLPKAHVEAPIAGSIILAGIILKLGGYGLIRLIVLYIKIGLKFNLIFIIISLIGGVIISLVCVCQRDLKSLIAYRSVAHIGIVLRGIITINFWGILGALFIILAHGLCSSGLFCLANINYERLERRRIYINKGLINILPSLSLWWFLFCACNIAAPPSINLLREIILISRIVRFRNLLILTLILLSFFAAVYSLFLFSYTQHGILIRGRLRFSIINLREYLLLFLHYIPLNFLVLKSELFILWL